MVSFNPNTTWIGVLGGGVTGALLIGGSVFQIDLWHMGGDPVPARVLVTSTRVGLVAEAGLPTCSLVVTGCRYPDEMDGITSSGIDWEASIGFRAGAAAKTGRQIAEAMFAEVAAEVSFWAMNEASKRYTQWLHNDLGIVKPGRQFNLLPWPMSPTVGAGVFYDWQKLQLMRGNLGWKYIKPYWSVENYNGSVHFHMGNIPEQDDTRIKIGLSLPRFGADPVICFESPLRRSGYTYFDGLVADAGLIEHRRSPMGGINLTKLRPVGLSKAGLFTVQRTDEVVRNGIVQVRPYVLGPVGSELWTARDTVEFETDSEGRFVRARGSHQPRK